MDARDARRAFAGCALLTLAGCAGASPPAPPSRPVTPAAAPPVAPQTVTPAAPAPPAPGTSEPEAVPPRETHEVLIEAGGDPAPQVRGLAAAAQAERDRRRGAATPMLSIDDKNLSQHATGSLTISSGPAPEAAAPAAGDGPDEQRWRQRVRTLREHWALSVETIHELEERAASLRTRFYAADDPYVRDGQIKPAWDHALESLAAARQRALEIELELEATLEEGARAGALPGWLREGLELEPTDFPYDRPDRGEPAEGELSGEPVILDEGGNGR